jgi:hypothetical protein
MGNSTDKPQSRSGTIDSSRKSSRPGSASTPSTPTQSKPFNTTILANRPIPPRPSIRPPSSSSQDSLVDHSPSTRPSHNIPLSRHPLVSEAQAPAPEFTSSTSRAKEGKENGIVVSYDPSLYNGQPKYGPKKEHVRTINAKPISLATPPVLYPASGKVNGDVAKPPSEHRLSKRLTAQPAVAIPETKTLSKLAAQHARELQRQLLTATTVDECRLLVDMFLAKSGLSLELTNDELPYPSPASSVLPSHTSVADADLEHSLVELLLGGDNTGHLRKFAIGTTLTDVSNLSQQDPSKPTSNTPSQIEDDTLRGVPAE